MFYKQHSMSPHKRANGLRNRFTVDDFAAVDDGTKIFARWYALLAAQSLALSVL